MWVHSWSIQSYSNIFQIKHRQPGPRGTIDRLLWVLYIIVLLSAPLTMTRWSPPPREFPNWGLFGIFSCRRENQTITAATKLTYSYSNETSWISHLFGIKYPPLTPSWSKCMQCFIQTSLSLLWNFILPFCLAIINFSLKYQQKGIKTTVFHFKAISAIGLIVNQLWTRSQL